MARLSHFISIAALLGCALFDLIGCRGYNSEKPPIHVNPNMDIQEKGKPYRANNFFADGKYMRSPIEGTVARGHLKEDQHFYYGKVAGQLAQSFPKDISLDEGFLQRGKQIYDRVCAACHSHVGDGEGLVGKRLMVRPPTFHSEYMYNLPPGHYFDVIINGIRTMRSYGHMIKEIDAWATVAYVRSLQMSQDIGGEWISKTASRWRQK